MVQSVSAAADGVGSGHVGRDAADWQISSLHVYPRLHFHHHVSRCAESDSEVSVYAHDAVVCSSRLHRITAATAVHAASR